MSFDLLLVNGDIKVGQNQDIALVTDYKKLIQDIIKIITTPQGTNKFQPQLGSLINERLIGKILTPQNTLTTLQSSVQEALMLLQKLQKQQAQVQAISPAETLIAINDVNIARDSVEPRQLNVVLKLTSGDGNTITESFTMRLM